MDSQIKKVRKDVQHNNKKRALKDITKLLKMDKAFDKKIEQCGKMNKSKKK